MTGLLAANLDTFTHQLDRVLPVAVQQSGLAPPYTQRRLGLGRLTMSVYANLSGLELPDRAQRRCEDHRICRWRGPPSRSSQPVALGSSVPWSFPLSLSLARLTGSFAKWNYHGHGNLPSGHRRTISTAAMAKTNTTAHAGKWLPLIASPNRSRARTLLERFGAAKPNFSDLIQSSKKARATQCSQRITPILCS